MPDALISEYALFIRGLLWFGHLPSSRLLAVMVGGFINLLILCISCKSHSTDRERGKIVFTIYKQMYLYVKQHPKTITTL